MCMDPVDLSDDELVRQGQYRDYELSILDGPGCVLSLLAACVLALAGLALAIVLTDFQWVDDPWWATYPLLALYVLLAIIGWGVLAFGVFALMIGLVVELRVGPIHAEMRRRFYPPDDKAFEDYLHEQVMAAHDWEWVLASETSEDFGPIYTAIICLSADDVTLEAWKLHGVPAL